MNGRIPSDLAHATFSLDALNAAGFAQLRSRITQTLDEARWVCGLMQRIGPVVRLAPISLSSPACRDRMPRCTGDIF